MKKGLGILLAIVMLVCMIPTGMAAETTASSAIDADQFKLPDIEYRPGVRWWWPGNAVSEEDLISQLDYLAENGFGAVEIVCFSAGFLTGDGTSSGSLYSALVGYDFDSFLSYDTPEYYAKLAAVVEHANELGITVDLNIGSGYLASDDSLDISDSQSNMALGRATITYQDDVVSVVDDEVALSQTDSVIEIAIPEAEISPLYALTLFSYDFGVWSEENVSLNAVIIAEITDDSVVLENNNQVIDLENKTVDKTYETQTEIAYTGAIVLYPEDGDETVVISTDELEAGKSYEVIALYSVPAGVVGLNAYESNVETGERAYVVDHLSAESITTFVDGWLSGEGFDEVLENEIRAAFNDSYEFYTDSFYNDRVQELATSGEILGYDITAYIPTIYKFLGESFLVGGIPYFSDEYTDVNDLSLSMFGSNGSELLSSALTDDEYERITYDYEQLVNVAFLEGMEAFSEALNEYGILYRQQAYNPPIDTLLSSKYVDIPETEGLSEYSLKRVSSGAHLYGKNLVTSEVYTLGTVPFSASPQDIKEGYDLMATSGVNNFFYHGLNALYFGDEDSDADDNYYTEEGWRAWPTIGVEMAETNVLSGYFLEMNTYASRANYVMQSGEQSTDVAVYMPLFGSLSSDSAGITVLETNGYVWDAINDDCIQTELTWDGERLNTADGVSFAALIIGEETVPVATMEALQALADQGAPIIFVGELPTEQPSYADGAYEELDAQVAIIAAEMIATSALYAADDEALAAIITDVVDVAISYEANESVRMNRRTYDTGSELAYIRNTSSEEATTITINVAADLVNCYWLDPSDGNIYIAENNNGTIEVTLPASGAMILLCEPEGVGMDSSNITEGSPLSICDTSTVMELDSFTLEVTADNIGTYIPGEVETMVYTGETLGDWSLDTFLDGDLKYVVSTGTYTTTFEMESLDQYEGDGFVVELTEVGSAATVYLNGELMGQVYYAPYEVDISDALVEGENTLVIEVQPMKVNRRLGLKLAYTEAGMEEYIAYVSNTSGDTLSSAGLIGPVVISEIFTK